MKGIDIIIKDLTAEYGGETPEKVKAFYDQVVQSNESPAIIEKWRQACELVGVSV